MPLTLLYQLLLKKSEIVRITIADKGPGISPDQLEIIFERFYRIPRVIEHSVQGVGLGLYISRKIIEAHGGKIIAESALGEGANIIIKLPIER